MIVCETRERPRECHFTSALGRCQKHPLEVAAFPSLQFASDVSIDQVGLRALDFREIRLVGECPILYLNLLLLRQRPKQVSEEQLFLGLFVSRHVRFGTAFLSDCQTWEI